MRSVLKSLVGVVAAGPAMLGSGDGAGRRLPAVGYRLRLHRAQQGGIGTLAG